MHKYFQNYFPKKFNFKISFVNLHSNAWQKNHKKWNCEKNRIYFLLLFDQRPTFLSEPRLKRFCVQGSFFFWVTFFCWCTFKSTMSFHIEMFLASKLDCAFWRESDNQYRLLLLQNYEQNLSPLLKNLWTPNELAYTVRYFQSRNQLSLKMVASQGLEATWRFLNLCVGPSLTFHIIRIGQ